MIMVRQKGRFGLGHIYYVPFPNLSLFFYASGTITFTLGLHFTNSYSVMSETGTAARINQKLYIIIIIIIIINIIIIIIINNNNNFI